jgi:hypothetical protein
MDPLPVWVRKNYYVEEPRHPQDPVIAYDKVTGKRAGEWPEGGYVPPEMYARYLQEEPGALGALRHHLKQHPELRPRYEPFLKT